MDGQHKRKHQTNTAQYWGRRTSHERQNSLTTSHINLIISYGRWH